jgi:hypothetical protein
MTVTRLRNVFKEAVPKAIAPPGALDAPLSKSPPGKKKSKNILW